MLTNKKGQVNLAQAGGLIVVLIVLGIILGIGGEVLNKFVENDAKTATNPVLDEQIGLTNGTSNQTASVPIIAGSETVYNRTNKNHIINETTNYILVDANGTISAVASLGTFTLWNISYNVSEDILTTAQNATLNAGQGIKTFSEFQTVIAIVLITILILGIILLIRTS